MPGRRCASPTAAVDRRDVSDHPALRPPATSSPTTTASSPSAPWNPALVLEEKIVQKLRLQPGKMLLIDLEAGPPSPTRRSSTSISTAHPYAQWIEETHFVLAEDLRRRCRRARPRRSRACSPAAGLRLHPGRPQAPDAADGRHRQGGVSGFDGTLGPRRSRRCRTSRSRSTPLFLSRTSCK